jgi:hypothetical protein
MLNHKADHVFHGWINSESGFHDEEPKESPINPHEEGLYSFKSAMNTLAWLPQKIGAERMRALPLVHQQCSHSAPEPLRENYLTCAFGVKLRECPILARLGMTFDAERNKTGSDGQPSYYADIPDTEIDKAKAMVCVWHMLMGQHKGYVDWNEGAVQDVSDRRFWDQVYSNLAQQDEG